MRLRVLFAGCVWSLGLMAAAAQMMGGEQEATTQPRAADRTASEAPAVADPAQKKAAQTFAGKAKVGGPKTVVSAPLSQRERVLQLLDRFTYGPRPGEVERVMALGADKWLEQQFSPETIPNSALDKRLAEFPTVNMTAEQALRTFPDRGYVQQVADGRAPYPADPMLAAVYEVQVWKWRQEQNAKNNGATPPTDEEKAAQKKKDQADAAQIAGELFALPKAQRMAALLKMPVEDRAAFTGNGNLTGDQRNLLFADMTPREREVFEAMGGQVNSSYYLTNELSAAHVLRDVLSERQLQEVMTDFWFNHFNVFINKDSDQWYTAAYERDVIRKNALGNFRDLLIATAQSPAMMVYLDNWLSIGPDSPANGVNPQNPNSKKGNRGLNENYGREVMELHTVGVKGGYSQADVTALSAILTGWSVDRPGQGGPFLFDQKRHEPGDKQWFGHVIHEGRNADGTPNGMAEGIEALNILAASPQTAHFISYLLVQKFVADQPPPALVERLATTFTGSHGDIKTVLRALVASPEFNSRQYFRNKVKTPVEFVASAFRATATDPQNPGAMVNTLKTMGMPLYQALPPTGYYLTADQWMNSSALVDRLNFAYQLTNGRFANQKFDAPKLLAMGLLTPAALPVLPAAAAKPVGSGAARGQAHVVGAAWAASGDVPTAPVSAQGADVALRVLEQTMIGGAVSAQTNGLIHQQMEQQPTNASATDTLNLLTALVMGSPEFQLR